MDTVRLLTHGADVNGGRTGRGCMYIYIYMYAPCSLRITVSPLSSQACFVLPDSEDPENNSGKP